MKIDARTKYLIRSRPLRGLIESYLSVDLGFRCALPQALCFRHASRALNLDNHPANDYDSSLEQPTALVK
jgi:hypothetical protein